VDPPLDLEIVPVDCYVLVPQLNNPFSGAFGGGMLFPGFRVCISEANVEMNLPVIGDPMPVMRPLIVTLVSLVLFRLIRGEG
jgi:hypothetical protein